MASATGLLLEGRVEEGLAQLLSLKKWALSHRWAYAASGVDFAAGPALAMTGRIGDGIRMLKAGISACDAAGSLAVASWNRLALAELYLGMLSARRAPSIKLILSNLPAIVKVKVTGNRQAKLLLEQIAQNSQIHEESTTRGWVEIDLAKLCFMRNRTSLARQHLGKARLAALAQESKPLSDEIDRLSAQLV
jgi:hypothetical protein